MKNLKIYLMMLLLACTTMSFAQDDATPWKGIRFGYDRTFVNYDWAGAEDDNANGFSIGYVHAFNIAKKVPLFIETGLGLNFARIKVTESGTGEISGNEFSYEDKTTTTMLGLTIPVNVVYKVQLNDMLALKPYTGFYLRANLMSKTDWEETVTVMGYSETEGETVNNFDEDEVGKNETWNRVQFGWQIGATLDINKFNVGLGYALDFNELAEKTKCGIFSVRLGYNF